MHKFSQVLLAETMMKQRKNLSITQAELAKLTGIHRAMISRIENETYIPTISQLEALADALHFDIIDFFIE